jgi:chromosome segregation ATPase
MSVEFKNKLDIFVKNIIMKVGNKDEDIPEIQKEYDDLIEFYEKLTILTNEEFSSLDNAMSKYDSSIKELQEKLNIYKSQKDIDDDKIKSMMGSMAENLELKESYKKINEDYNSYKQKYNFLYNENIGYQMKLKTSEKTINDLQEEISNLKKENFEKFEKIIFLEKNFKLNEIKLSQAMEKITKYSIENNDLSKENIELRNNLLDQKKTYQSKLLILERQVKHLSEANSNFLQENNEVQTQLKDFQMYTNFAKANAVKLDKKDFSILETMSKRAETAELQVQKLALYVNDLRKMNEKLKHKIKPLEDYALLQIKHDHEINTGNNTTLDFGSKIFTEEEKNEINKLKNEPNELFQALIKLKTENLELHNQLKDITIECNQQLREAKLKK